MVGGDRSGLEGVSLGYRPLNLLPSVKRVCMLLGGQLVVRKEDLAGTREEWKETGVQFTKKGRCRRKYEVSGRK